MQEVVYEKGKLYTRKESRAHVRVDKCPEKMCDSGKQGCDRQEECTRGGEWVKPVHRINGDKPYERWEKHGLWISTRERVGKQERREISCGRRAYV